jgi:hypothetical protein
MQHERGATRRTARMPHPGRFPCAVERDDLVDRLIVPPLRGCPSARGIAGNSPIAARGRAFVEFTALFTGKSPMGQCANQSVSN